MPESLVQEKKGSRSMAGARSTVSRAIRYRKAKPLIPKWVKRATGEFVKDVAYGSNRKKSRK